MISIEKNGNHQSLECQARAAQRTGMQARISSQLERLDIYALTALFTIMDEASKGSCDLSGLATTMTNHLSILGFPAALPQALGRADKAEAA